MTDAIAEKMMAYCKGCILFLDCGGEHASIYSIYPGEKSSQIIHTYKCGMEKAPKPFFNVTSDHHP